jgi:hypothetical protein
MARRRVMRASTTILLVFAAVLTTVRPVAAECMFVPPFPRADAAIRSAQDVIVGDVVPFFDPAALGLGPDDGPREIALRVTEKLRGSHAVGELIDIQYLQPNWPWWKYRGGNGQAFPSCTYLLSEVEVGETIALALGAVQPRQRLEADGQSWIQPRTIYNAMSKIRDPERLAEIRRLAELPQTDMAPPGASSAVLSPGLPWVLIFAIGALAGAAAWSRAGRYRE